MAKGKYHDWLKPENLHLIRSLRRDGLTIDQVAKYIGISQDTIYRWIKDFPEFSEAIKTGKRQANAIIENRLFQKAASGNMTAIIFYLKNNWRDKYNDSTLGPEERKMIQAKMRKLEADTRVSEAKAKLADQVSSQNNAELERMLKLLEIEGTEDGD
ncbi:helix-turn-helix transcriptional regulator [Lactobacillus mulieris]|jgi:hypothetical protein|uniref:DNA-packaging protein n=1 Tax=Lactobacillus mulieris TaxID=2508708 RepID=A0ABT4K181_9LACO|nr:helix-turn-helix domain-containing protein [Lactobacillus mulieris]MCZ3621879.1 DNA-packaging protein [Lactobacillus mulieris]MCZ3623576.1 DNA-packaging protein [Lactobacillus mulieris]MCZ3635886.1 DNA-packaging protein [Lactobacillus mulieris]DAT07828.1 MAG TPA: terminase small subunit [Caudoviricetes sp.]